MVHKGAWCSFCDCSFDRLYTNGVYDLFALRSCCKRLVLRRVFCHDGLELPSDLGPGEMIYMGKFLLSCLSLAPDLRMISTLVRGNKCAY